MKTLAWGCLMVAAAFGAGVSQGASGMATGAYTCLNFGEVQEAEMNFTVTGPTAYTGADNRPGAYSMSGNHVNFETGALAGVLGDGVDAVYDISNGVPTLHYQDSFRNNEEQGIACQHVS